MKSQKDINAFNENQANILLANLKNQKILPDLEADAFVHALADISESFDKIYSQTLPKILSIEKISPEELKELLWDIREEFRHIQYHINDAKLTD